MDLLLGCKVTFEDNGVEKTGVIVKIDAQHDGSYFWLLTDGGEVLVKRINVIKKINKKDVDLINEFSANRIKRLEMMARETPISREELIDFDN